MSGPDDSEADWMAAELLKPGSCGRQCLSVDRKQDLGVSDIRQHGRLSQVSRWDYCARAGP